MKKYSKRQKIVVIGISALLATIATTASYFYFLSQMNEWQKTREVDFSSNSGSTIFKARLDSLSIGGIVFCASAISIIAVKKFKERK